MDRDIQGKSKKASRLTLIGACGLVMMLTHQNCGQPQSLVRATASDSSAVSTIDDVNATTGLNFSSKATEIHSQTTAILIEGTCATQQQNSVLAWKVRDTSSEAGAPDFGTGYANCVDGKFEVELQPTQELECDVTYKLTARLGLGSPGETLVSRRCAADKSTVISNTAADSLLSSFTASSQGNLKVKSSGISSNATCMLEQRVSKNTCQVVCYSQDGVVEGEKNLDLQSCSK